MGSGDARPFTSPTDEQLSLQRLGWLCQVRILSIKHHRMMGTVREVSRRFLGRTLLLLPLVSLIPRPTAIAADYATRGPQGTVAAVLYAATMLLTGLSFSSGWRHLASHPRFPSRPALRSRPARMGVHDALGAEQTCSAQAERLRHCHLAVIGPGREPQSEPLAAAR
jgi:hypothetical protein